MRKILIFIFITTSISASPIRTVNRTPVYPSVWHKPDTIMDNRSDRDSSPTPMLVNVISGDHLDGEAAAKNMAHEAFGHAYLYETNGHDGQAAGHHRNFVEGDYSDIYVDPETGLEWTIFNIGYDKHPNDILQQYIDKATNEASTNFNCE